MTIRLALPLLLLLTAPLRAAAPTAPASRPDAPPAAFTALINLGATNFAAYIPPTETSLKFDNQFRGTDADLQHLKDLTTTTYVIITGDKNAALLLPHLADMPALLNVWLEDVTLTPAQIRQLAAVKVKSISITTESPDLSFDTFPNLERLALAGPVANVTISGAPALKVLLLQSPVESHAKLALTLTGSPKLTYLGLKNFILADFPFSPTLESLDLSGCTFPDTLLEKIPQLKNLTTLLLPNVPNAGKILSRLADSHLKTLNAGNAHITDADIAAIKDLSHIGSLDLSGNPDFTGKGMAPVGTVGEMLQIVFRQTAVNDDTIAALAATTKSRGLFIYLDDTPITDKSVAALAALPDLIKISLTHTRITDAALTSLATAKRLDSADLAHTSITPAALAALHQALPKATLQNGVSTLPPTPALQK